MLHITGLQTANDILQTELSLKILPSSRLGGDSWDRLQPPAAQVWISRHKNGWMDMHREYVFYWYILFYVEEYTLQKLGFFFCFCLHYLHKSALFLF